MAAIIELKNIDKRFTSVYALKNVSLAVEEGETIALVGENGAGKSTLMKILTGAYQKDSGNICIDGKSINLCNTANAKNYGIAQVYQQAELWPELTIAENIYLGEKDMAGRGIIDWNSVKKGAQEILDKYEIHLDANRMLKGLSVASYQLVSIAKVLKRNPRVIIFDEPTAVLSDKEVSVLFNIIRMLKKQRVTIIYISHRLEEIFELCDRVAVMRDGEMVTVLNNDNLTKNDLISHMLGRSIETIFPRKAETVRDKVALECSGISTRKVTDISFRLYKGEILGIIGLVNSGRTELARAVYGVDAVKSGSIAVGGKPVRFKTPVDAAAKGLFLAPEDRKGEALVTIRQIRENITLSNLRTISRRGICNIQKEKKLVDELMKSLRIKAASMESRVNSLSGGNQQKVVIAKAIATDPDILIFDEPTQGIDIGAKAEIYELLEQLRQKGKSIILISSEIEEIQGMCSRALVMRNGRIVGEVNEEIEDTENILSLMYRSDVCEKE